MRFLSYSAKGYRYALTYAPQVCHFLRTTMPTFTSKHSLSCLSELNQALISLV
nr:MAG TPA: hypothetical protein [Caudoviricetes sp.]